jgi:hypothetical protein
VLHSTQGVTKDTFILLYYIFITILQSYYTSWTVLKIVLLKIVLKISVKIVLKISVKIVLKISVKISVKITVTRWRLYHTPLKYPMDSLI